jgi:hypothetical protein
VQWKDVRLILPHVVRSCYKQHYEKIKHTFVNYNDGLIFINLDLNLLWALILVLAMNRK